MLSLNMLDTTSSWTLLVDLLPVIIVVGMILSWICIDSVRKYFDTKALNRFQEFLDLIRSDNHCKIYKREQDFKLYRERCYILAKRKKLEHNHYFVKWFGHDGCRLEYSGYPEASCQTCL